MSWRNFVKLIKLYNMRVYYGKAVYNQKEIKASLDVLKENL